jgi:hypothetical protein
VPTIFSFKHSETLSPVPATKTVSIRSGSCGLIKTANACTGVRIIPFAVTCSLAAHKSQRVRLFAAGDQAVTLAVLGNTSVSISRS